MSKTKRRIVFLGLLVALAFFAAAIGLTFKPNTAYADGGLDIVSAGGNPVKRNLGRNLSQRLNTYSKNKTL